LVHIKKLEIYGFKSFGFKNKLVNLDRGLVAVTGPNGSGKSNILDAILFAIGENSPKALRVNKLQSLFHDAQNNGHRLIRVSITLDNSDRGIPVDSDAVVIVREMEGQTGESQYILNGKRSSKSVITELLEIVVAVPNKLNVVQQGMITRISEINPEERRHIIEDIVGLSYFDEKKTEALKQLDESDKRLEVALAKIGEIRKRIDELEEERNSQLRYETLDSEMKRLGAIRLSSEIRAIKTNLANNQNLLNSNTLRASELASQVEDLQKQLVKLQTEKAKFYQDIDTVNKTKTQIGSKITNIVYVAERKKAELNESEQRLLQIDKRIQFLDIERQNVNKNVLILRSQIEEKSNSLSELSSQINALQKRLKETNEGIQLLTDKKSKYSKIGERLEYRFKRLSELKNNMSVSIARLEERSKTLVDKIKFHESTLDSTKKELGESSNIVAALLKHLHVKNKRLDAITHLEIYQKNSIRDPVETELARSSKLLLEASSLTTKFEVEANVARDQRSEDIAIVELMKSTERFGIRGLLHNILKWDKQYEKPVLAAIGIDLMKSLVVDDIRSMILIAEYAKLKKLPRLKLIPLNLDVRYNYRKLDLPGDFENDLNIIGNLADFVHSDYKALVIFLFGSTYLVRFASTAYMLAKNGYRAVTAEGELFEPFVRSISLNFDAKISDLTRSIIVSDSVNSLRLSMDELTQMIKTKKSDLDENFRKMNHLITERFRIENDIKNLADQISSTNILINSRTKDLEDIESHRVSIESEYHCIQDQLHGYMRRLEIVSRSITRIMGQLRSIHEATVKDEKLFDLNKERNDTLSFIDKKDNEIRNILHSITESKGQLQNSEGRLMMIDEEQQQLKTEANLKLIKSTDLRIKLESIEKELGDARDEEQKIIDSSRDSHGIFQEYEEKIRKLSENERAISREYNHLEKENAILSKDITELETKQVKCTNDLNSFGYRITSQSCMDYFDNLDVILKELTSEFDNLKNSINLRANESYTQVIQGYRSMSERKNELETERNSIVFFIEQIDKEKKALFMDAFKKVDTDIRKTFSQVTGEGGSAWMELENADNVFAGGILLMVQFPDKPVRESTALSGGEKTMAATIFLLALQSLKPSPFYLMDEIDAHLDAQNTERLSNILLERARDSQIIIVTLKDSTVAKANLIYGVYPHQGASQIVRYKHSPKIELNETISK
jgi:chromosome segregation protein